MIAPRVHVNGHATDSKVPREVRCAIYVRKSTEEGLEQAFNSLDAQRLACEEYTRARAADHWTALPEQYTDGGWSGATVKRPAFQRLLSDIEAQKVDCVIVHRLDRLSRSLLDFARLMHFFQDHGVSFVSVTQNFSTADPTGRMTLSLLAVFSEFEREMIVARTRDKVAAARRQGRWTGGCPILGYDVDPRGGRLLVNEDEAVMVREIFGIYVRERSLTRVVEDLERRGWRRKTWTKRDGKVREGSTFDKPGLLRLLKNPLYAGKVHHRGTLHDGEHPAIVDETVWSRVQGLLHRNGSTGGKDVRNKHGALLRGLLRCARCDCAMSHSFTRKGNVRYRYYVCQTRFKKGAHACPGGKVSAHEAERQVVDRIRTIGRDPELIAEVVRQARMQLDERRVALEAEQRQFGKDLKRERASLRRLSAGRPRNGDASAITARLADIQQRIERVERRLVTVAQDLASAKLQVIDEREVAAALSAFDSVWDGLIPTEQARILGLLTERISYDGHRLEIAFRPGGIGKLHELQHKLSRSGAPGSPNPGAPL
jgi:site-specific DNA recombinase